MKQHRLSVGLGLVMAATVVACQHVVAPPVDQHEDPAPVSAPVPACQPLQGTFDVTVSVNPAVGPLGTSPRRVTNALWSMNIFDQERTDYMPSIDPTFAGYLSALRPRYLRWPAGWPSQ